MAGCKSVGRVLMTADTVGGVWTYALELARGLGAHGVEVALATMGAPLSMQQARDAAELPNLQIHESRFKLEWMDDPWADVQRAGDWLLTLESDLAPDLVHLNGYAHGNLPWQAAHIVVAHSCVLSWWNAVKGVHPRDEWSRYCFAASSGLRGAHFVVAPTHAMLTEIQRHYGPLRYTAVIANARSAEPYACGLKECFVLAAGRVWDEAKNIAVLSSVASAVDWPIYVAGDRRHPNGGSLELPNVRLVGLLSPVELADYYSRAAIYCHPAVYEPFGLSVLEAALSGCALVLGDIPSLRENWDGAAVFVDPRDTAALQWQLRQLTGDPHRLRTLGDRARRRAGRFSVERMSCSYLDLYSALKWKRQGLAAAGD